MKQSAELKRIVFEKETIELRTLRVFERIARLRSVTAAAAELGLPKSAASKALTRLERQLGARLLERTSRRITLTDAGRVALARADSLLAEADALGEAVREVHSTVRGRLVIAAPPDLGTYLAGGFFPRLLERYPELSVELALDYGFADLLDPAFDLAFRVGGVHDDRLVARKVGNVQRVLVASPGFARAHPARTPAELERTPVLVFSEGPPVGRIELTNGRRTVEVTVRGRLAARSFPALLRAAEAGLGVAMVPEIVARDALSRGAVQRVLPRWRPAGAPILLVYRSGHQRLRRVAALIELALETACGVPQ